MKRRNRSLSVLHILVLVVIFLSLIPVHADPPGPPNFHYILGSATYGRAGPSADGALVTVMNMNTSETLTDVVGVFGQSNQSGWYLVDLLDFNLGYRHGDVIQVHIMGTDTYSDWEGLNDTTVDNITLSQIVHVSLAGHPPMKPSNINPVPGSINVGVSPILRVYVVDPDGEMMDVSFYDALDDTLIGSVSQVPNASHAQIVWFGLQYNTTYTWYAVANDSLLENISDNWSFTTQMEPVNLPPMASFFWTPVSPTTLDTIHFMDFSTDDGGIISWKWEFGDGGISYLKNPVHIYSDNGRFMVNLTVMDNQGIIDTLSKNLLITNIPPRCNFTSFSDGITVNFMDTSLDIDGHIVSWYWEFGDGTSSIQQHPGHRYNTPGIYSVYLRTLDNDGDYDQFSRDIIILPEDRYHNVTITYPLGNQILSGTHILTGTAYGNVTILRVDIKVDNGPWQEATGTTNWTYLWDTKNVDNGFHILYARGYDGEYYSPLAMVTLQVYNNHPPVLSITRPWEDQTIKGKTRVQGWATDKDGNATLTLVELMIDAGDWIMVQGTTLWLYELNTSELTNGYHTLSARAFDGSSYSEIFSRVVKVDNRDELFGFDKVFIFGGIALILAFVVALLVIVAVLIHDKSSDKEQKDMFPVQPDNNNNLTEWPSLAEDSKTPYKMGDYVLYTKLVARPGNKKQRIYFFSKKKNKGAVAIKKPRGYKVTVNKKTGVPILKKEN
jgi:PKD repeat protein